MGSSRLPGKVLKEAAGRPLLDHLLERLRYARRLDSIVVATSSAGQDDPIEALCIHLGVPCFRGSEHDVLDRYHRAARWIGAEAIVRITADCPLVDPGLVDRMVELAQAGPTAYDLITNRHPLTFPDGLDVDVMPRDSLERAWREATTPRQREHVIPYFWEAGLRVKNVEHPDKLFLSQRWTVDYEEDYNLVRAVLEALYEPGRPFGMQDVLDWLATNPGVAALNHRYLPARIAM